MTDAAGPTVITPTGLPILEAGTWIGQACWAELRLHAVLTRWLAVEADGEASLALWAERSEAAERAAAWHARLPELREYPRTSFVGASSDGVAALFDRLEGLDHPEATGDRRAALAAVLRGLRLGYHAHQALAVGPADGPTATTLIAAVRSTFGDDGTDPDPTWVAAIADAGGLP